MIRRFVTYIVLFFTLLLSSCGSSSFDEYGLPIYNSDSALKDISIGKVRILTYGLELSEYPECENYFDSLNKEFRFQYENLGCEVSDKFRAGVKEYNLEVYKYLEKTNGKGWEQLHKQKMDSCITARVKNNNSDTIH